MANSWTRLEKTALTGTNDVIRVPASGTFDAKKRLYVEMHLIPSGSINGRLTFNDDEGSSSNNYAIRRMTDGGSLAGYTGLDYIEDLWNGASQETFVTMEIFNIDGQQKMVFSRSCTAGATGLNDTSQAYIFGAWTGTDQIQSLKLTNGSGGDYAAGSTITVFGSDEEITANKSTITNVPAGTRYEETDTRKIFRRTVAVVGDETTVSSLTDVVFDDATKIGTVTYSGNEITLSGSTSHVDSINANLQFQNSGTQIVECDAENTGTSAWITFGLASAKVTDSGSDHGAQLEYGIRKADDGRTFIMTSSGTFGSSLGTFHDNSKLRITNNRTTVTYEISENGGSWSSLGSTTHGTPNATYYLQATVAQTGTAGSYTFDYTGDVIITTGTNAWVEKGTA